MSRRTPHIPVLAGLLAIALVPPPARAATYMWGVGGKLGTAILPGRYPLAWPAAVDAESTSLERVRADFSFGASGLYWANENSRIGADLGMGFASGYREWDVLVRYHRMYPTQALDWFWGGGAGVGLFRFTGQDPEELRVPDYPLRVEGGVLIRQNRFAFQGSLHVQYAIPGISEYTDSAGATSEVGWGLYGLFGAELAIYFGDFQPPPRS